MKQNHFFINLVSDCRWIRLYGKQREYKGSGGLVDYDARTNFGFFL